MRTIRYAQIINSFVSTEGSDGIMTNYIYYSILVTYNDGSHEIVEGKNSQVSHLLYYLRSPIDELLELKDTIGNLRKDISAIADEKMQYVIDTLYPIPDLTGLNETEAEKQLHEAGLKPVYVYKYPEGTPRLGVVHAFQRCSDQFKAVNLEIIHELPNVVGLPQQDALTLLGNAGFHTHVECIPDSSHENDTVVSCSRDSESSLEVHLAVCSQIPDTVGLPAHDAVEALERLGYTVVLEHVPSQKRPNCVVTWTATDPKTIKLTVGIADELRCPNVSVRASDMMNSPGDRYTASAVYSNITNRLTITLNYTINAKAKHKPTNVACKAIGTAEAAFLNYVGTMEPGVQGRFDIVIPFEKDVFEPPRDLSATLNTVYGLMNKEESVSFQFQFNW